MKQTDAIRLLVELLPPWFAQHARNLPWRQDREPYHVWISEIMLQQTRVEAVKGYYARFLEAVPDIPTLAAADPELLHKLWEGLGYYSRVRNLQKAAKAIMTEHGGRFPDRWEAVRALPGIGDYTAGAVCSICFDLPTPAVDGNVLRVLARLRADKRCIDDAAVKKAVRAELAAVYPARGAGILTQALMELGATVCIPNGAPCCEACPLSGCCASRERELWKQLPVRREKRPRRRETMTVFVLDCGGALALRKRPSVGLLAGLWEFPHVSGHLDAQAALDQASRWGVRPVGLEKQLERTHIFTHIQWDMRCFYLACGAKNTEFIWAEPEELDREYALPTAFRMFRPEKDMQANDTHDNLR